MKFSVVLLRKCIVRYYQVYLSSSITQKHVIISTESTAQPTGSLLHENIMYISASTYGISGTTIQEFALGTAIALVTVFTRILHLCHDQVSITVKASNLLECSTFYVQTALKNWKLSAGGLKQYDMSAISVALCVSSV